MQMVGHELATPLSTISMSINNYLKELKQLAGAPGDPPEFPPEVLVNLSRAARIARELQFYLKGKRREEFDFREAIRKSYKSLDELYPGLEIITDPWPEKKYILMANPSALEQAVFNILLNAAQMMNLCHRPQGVIRISLQQEPHGWAKLLVQDTGPGIHRQDFERIFQDGFSTKIRGAGLGLGISRRLLEDMGGSLKISYSLLFVSSCFEIKLPLVRVE
jgi:signal transduction histidine kinase